MVDTWRDDPAWPDVDVVMPVRDEAEHLAAAVASVRSQGYPGRVRSFLAVAPSVDATASVAARLAGDHDDVTVVDNPAGTIPAGLNRAIAAGSGSVVVRVDGHSELPTGYVERAVATLRRTGATNVGGRQVPLATTRFEQAVADVTSSWLGTGGARYRVGGSEGPVDTVFLGVFDRRALDDVGGYDEVLLTNEDYELNIRLRDRGHRVWFDPALEVGYRPRSGWRPLARQYHRYGFWKAHVARRHPRSLRARQMIPPVAMLVAATGLLAGPRRPVTLLAPLGYVGAVLVASRARWRVAAVAAVMHTSWSVGLLHGALCSIRRTG